MAFLRNRAVNWLNLHTGIRALAEGMGAAFVWVFLLRAGVPVPSALCAMAAILAARFALRPTVLVAGKRFGLRPLVIAGNLVIALEYLVLPRVRGVDELLLAYCLVSALGHTFYWTGYHAYFALLGDSEHRGHQISAGVALSAIAGIVAPLVGAWSLLRTGPGPTFGAVAVIQALSSLPLLATPNLTVPQTAPGSLRAALPGFGLFMADGWWASSFFLVWQIALFLSVGSSVSAYGGAMALAALVGALSGLLLGRHIDAGYGRRSVSLALTVAAVTLLLRALSLGTPWLAVGANALGALALCLLVPAQMTPVYNLAKKSPCALRFAIASEGGWDLGGCAGCLLAAGLIAHGTPFGAVLLFGFLGLAAQAYLLRRYYRQLGTW